MDPDTRGLGLAPATAGDYRELALRRLPRHLFDYLDGAAYDEVTAGENRQAFHRLRLRQRVLRDVSQLNFATRVLGQDLALPLILGPLGIAGVMARRAEVQAARAAEAAGVPFVRIDGIDLLDRGGACGNRRALLVSSCMSCATAAMPGI